MDSRTKFLKIYANIPVALRSEIVLVIDGEPVTWNVIWLEVEENTPISKKMLKKLELLKII